MLLRHVVNNDHLKIWFRGAGKPFCFSVEEFCLLIGLKGLKPDKVVVPDDDSLILAYFQNMGNGSLKREEALNVMLQKK